MQPDEMIGKVLGHYKLVRSLGVGGTAFVFRAQDINLQRDVALKLFQPHEGETRDFLQRFIREARVVAQLDHPNILPVYDYGEQDSLAYLVMPQMVDSLRDRLAGNRVLSPAETVRIISPVLNALQYAHDRGLIHRDIKPGNILFKSDGTPMLSDFGLVKVLTPSSEQTLTMNQTASMTSHVIAGTPDYMSPEQINGQVTPASDIYSIGIVLYEMLSGTRPFTADTYMGVLMKQVYEPPRSLRSVNPQIPLQVENVVLRALEKDATKRYQRPDELRRALESAVRGMGTQNTLTTPVSYATDPMPTVKQSSEQEYSVQNQSRRSFTPLPPTVDTGQTPPAYPTTPATPFTPPSIASHGQGGQGNPYQRPRSSRVPLLVGLILLIVLLLGGLATAIFAPPPFGFARRGTSQTPTTSTPPVQKTAIVKGNTTPTATPGTTPITRNVPTTTINCPTTGTARAAITAPLVLGSHRDLLYIVNEFSSGTPTFGTLKRRDVDSNLKATEMTKMAGTSISEAQVSQDGQWVLFVAHYNGQDQLRLVRVDGQGLQTLYCAPSGASIMGSQWSFDQHSVLFDTGSKPITTYLLDITTGNVQPEIVPQGQTAYIARTWLDATHVYLTSFSPASTTVSPSLYLLNLQKGANQHDGDLQQIVTLPQSCDSFDTSYDLTQLLLSTCNRNGSQQGLNGPSSITSQPITGNTLRTIYTTSTLAITMIRAVTPTTLLLMIENTVGDTSQNGLWKINPDGSSPTRLSSDTDGSQSLCPYSQYAWSNVSRDGTMYALESYNPRTNTFGMYYGSVSGGTPTQFAGINDGTQLYLVGWTNL